MGSLSFCLRLRVNLRAFFDELLGFFFHAFVERLFFGDLLLGGVFPDVFGDVDGAAAPERRPAGNAARCLSWRARLRAPAHRAEMRAAHGAEVGALGAFLGEGLTKPPPHGDFALAGWPSASLSRRSPTGSAHRGNP